MSANDNELPGFSFAADLQLERDRFAKELDSLVDSTLEYDGAHDAIRDQFAELQAARGELDLLAEHAQATNDTVLAQEVLAAFDAFDVRMAALLPKIIALSDREEGIERDGITLSKRAQRISLTAQHSEAINTQATRFDQEREYLADFTARAIKASGVVPAATGVVSPPAVTGDPLSAVIEAYCDNQNAEGCWTAKTDAENRAILAQWLNIVGDQPITGYGYEQHRAYKLTIQRLPPNINKSPRYRGKSIDEIIALGDKPAAPNTVNKNLTRISALFRWAVEYGYTALNPAGGMTIKNPKRASEERQAFSDGDLTKLFHRKDYCRERIKQPYKYWAALIALFTGARQNEIAQLHLADFCESDGIPLISINDQGEGKRLKTKAGKRSIPIHAELVRLGLLRYVDELRTANETRLFPELKLKRDGYGQTISRWFQSYRRKCGISEDGKVFHSFRHTVIDRLKQADVPKEKIAALVGHEDDSVTFGRYGKDFSPAIMREVVATLDFAHITGHVAPYCRD
ncbi:site-specific integrase [Ferribacterium limneticum]|uniref:site-specific integrase n=1 Tax=Ferribacterium limneticum TaxID=76259 RepID=UPI001CFA7AC3|nr:site-specific integrase [Ferribacterium limneticum]UCV28420.1 site-specific integrase [Ferribacterium limneticum]UCV32337.1 site-specific integrase [Ferribacterium limneticum]